MTFGRSFQTTAADTENALSANALISSIKTRLIGHTIDNTLPLPPLCVDLVAFKLSTQARHSIQDTGYLPSGHYINIIAELLTEHLYSNLLSKLIEASKMMARLNKAETDLEGDIN